jgi:choline-sulfatase
MATPKRPNFLFIITDQQAIDTISANGCPYTRTPALDHLANTGVSFLESHSANPLCSPARSSFLTSRMTSETGVVVNNRAIRSDIPNIGQWLGERGYETVYAGKWHLPQSFTPEMPGFNVICTGLGGLGNLGDSAVSRACEGYLRNRRSKEPFLLVASFLQPHDICQWVTMHQQPAQELPYPALAGELPPLPDNFGFDAREPKPVAKRPSRTWGWPDWHWRYYIWSYYRHVEMVDAEIGRVIQALEDSGQRENTVVLLTADHGEGMARHQMVTKNYLYESALKVPLLFSSPGQIAEGVRDQAHLVSGYDIVPTLCGYAGVETPPRALGRSLRLWLEGREADGHEFVAAEVTRTGRMIRTERHKYIMYHDDPVEQLFDMRADPGETKNLAGDQAHAAALEEHRKLLRDFEARLDVAPEAAG